jgi:hypothetical protein
MKPIAYTYLIGWSNLNRYYYGVRYKKGCTTSELWVNYFTSSKRVHQFREQHGEPDIIEVRKTFSDVQKARMWEHGVLRRLNAANLEKWLNCTDNKAIILDDAAKAKLTANSRGKSYEERFGAERAAELRRQRSESNRKRGARSEETRQRISERRKELHAQGELNFTPPPKNTPRYGADNHSFGKPALNRGVPRDEATKAKIRATLAATRAAKKAV